MAAGHDGWEARVAAGSAGEDVADAVHRHGAASLLAPADGEAPRLAVATAGVGPAPPALFGGADPRQLRQARPQPLAIDRQIAHATSGFRGETTSSSMIAGNIARESVPTEATCRLGIIARTSTPLCRRRCWTRRN